MLHESTKTACHAESRQRRINHEAREGHEALHAARQPARPTGPPEPRRTRARARSHCRRVLVRVRHGSDRPGQPALV